MTVIGLIGSIIAYALLGDWQALRPDSCIEQSLFHHPYLQHQYITHLANYNSVMLNNTSVVESFPCERLNQSLTKYYLAGTDIYVQPAINMADLPSKCELVHSCHICSDQDLNLISSICSTSCPHLRFDLDGQCNYSNHPQPKETEAYQGTFFYFCSMYIQVST